MDAIHLAAAGPVERPRVSAVGTLFASGAVVMFFAGLFGIYLFQREAVGHAAWLEGVTIPLGPPSMMMATLGFTRRYSQASGVSFGSQAASSAQNGLSTTLVL